MGTVSDRITARGGQGKGTKMKIKGFVKEGQSHCWDCGKPFVVSGLWTTHCPDKEHNRGSWFQLAPDRDFCVPVELDATIVRRQVEDRIRKEPKALLECLEVLDF
jgi:hypothetical protein